MKRSAAQVHPVRARAAWVRRVARWMLVCLVLQAPGQALAQAPLPLAAAPAAPAGQRPLLDAARNGVPIVMIAPPSAAGVSRNQYQQFNVNPNGLILNNSPGAVSTQLGGWIAGNLQLGPAPARLIVNEVVGAQASQLLGVLEVAGQRADLVIANPNGLFCDGCAPLNSSRMTLATGQPQYGAQGMLQGFDVRTGQLAIGSGGLNATELEQLDLIARGLVLDGQAWAQNLYAIAGANQVRHDTLQALPQEGSGAAPRFAIDIKELGGLNAGQLRLLATEQGLGVNSSGRLAALQGNLVLSANGDLSLKDSHASAGMQLDANGAMQLTGLTQSGADMQLQATGQLSQQGRLDAGGSLAMQAGAWSNTGQTVQRGAGPMRIAAAGAAANAGTLHSAGALTLQAARFDDSGGQILAGGDLDLQAQAIRLSGTGIATGGDLTLAASAGDLLASGSQLAAGGRLDASASGQLANTGGIWQAGTALALSGTAIGNAGGTLAAGAALQLATPGLLDNAQGRILAGGQLALQAGATRNAGGVIQGGTASTLHTGAIDNRQGALSSLAGLALDTGGAELDNDGGSLQANGSLAIRAGAVRSRAGALISSGSQLTLQAASLDNDGSTLLADTLALALDQGSLSNRGGHIAAADWLQLQAGATDNQGGRILAGQSLQAMPGSLDNSGGMLAALAAELRIDTQGQAIGNDDGILQAGGSIALASGALSNSRGLILGQDIDLTSAAFDNRAGQVVAQGRLALASQGLDNRAGLLQSHGDLLLDAGGGAIFNRDSGEQGGIAAGGALFLRGASLDNRNGYLASQGAQHIALAGALDNRDGLLHGNADSAIAAGQVFNGDGRIGVLGALALGAAQGIANGGGQIQAGTDATLASAHIDNRQGMLGAQGRLAIQSTQLDNEQGSILGDRGVDIAAAGAGIGGTISSLGDISLHIAGDYTHTGNAQAQGRLSIEAANLDNQGRLAAGGLLAIDSGELRNAGEISGGGLQITLGGKLTNTAAGLIDGGDSTITAAAVDNAGRLYGDVLRLGADTLDNHDGGAIMARQHLLLGVRQLANREGGLLYSLGDIDIGGALGRDTVAGQAQDLLNASSTIEAAGRLRLDIARLVNRDDHLVTARLTQAPVAQEFLQPSGSPNRYPLAQCFGIGQDGNAHCIVHPDKYGQRSAIAPARATLLACSEDGSCQQLVQNGYAWDDPVFSRFGVAPLAGGPPAAPAGGCASADGAPAVTPACQQWRLDTAAWNSAYEAALDALAPHVDAYNAQVVEDNRLETFEDYTLYQVDAVASRDVIVSSSPGRLLAGGDIDISGAVQNRDSMIVAGGANRIDASQLQNIATSDNGRISYSGTARFSHVDFCHLDDHCRRTDAAQPYNPPPVPQQAALQTVVYQDHAIDASAARGISGAAGGAVPQAGAVVAADGTLRVPGGFPPDTMPAVQRVAAADHSQDLVLGIGASLTLPDSPLYRLQVPPDAGTLIVTDPRFTGYREFLSSDYLLQALAIDPARNLKRFADGFYEQQLINDAILALTGRRYLAGYSDTETEYQALLDAGIAYARRYQLTPGIALSAAQMAQLTTDIVWLTTQTVTLADGSTQEVLVPQLYLRRPQDGDLQAGGALIAGSSVRITTQDDLVNSGSISGDLVEGSAGRDLNNETGRISAQQLYLRANNDLRNVSGLIAGIGAGSQLALSAGRDIVVQTQTIASTSSSGSRVASDRIATLQGGDITLLAGRDIVLAGGNVAAQGELLATAQRDISIAAVANQYQLHSSDPGRSLQGRSPSIDEARTSHQLATLSAGGNARLIAAGDVTLTGAELAAGTHGAGDALLVGRNVQIAAVLDRSATDVQTIGRNDYNRVARDDQSLAGGKLGAAGNVTLLATGTATGTADANSIPPAGGGDITLAGAYLGAGSGQVLLRASNDVTITSIATQHEYLDESHTESRTLFSRSATTQASQGSATQAQGSLVSGNTVAIVAGERAQQTGTITIAGSGIVGDGQVDIIAGNDVQVLSADQASHTASSLQRQRSGLFSTGGASLTLGRQQIRQEQDGSSASQSGSSIGSLGGNLNIMAGNTYRQSGSQLLAPQGDAQIDAARIQLDPAVAQGQGTSHDQEQHSGLTLALSNPVLNALQTMQQAGQAAGKTEDARAQALAGATLVMAGRQAIQAAQSAGATDFGLSLTLGHGQSDSRRSQSSLTQSGGEILAGGKVTLLAHGAGQASTIDALGATIRAGGDATLRAEGDINLGAAQRRSMESRRSSSSSAGIGVAVLVGSSGMAAGITANAASARGNSDASSLTYQGSEVRAGGNLTLHSGGDVTLDGAQLSARRVAGDIAGKLDIVSLQDQNRYTSQDQSLGGSLTLGMGAAGSLSFSNSQVTASYSGVGSQAGIYAGDAGFDLTVKGGTFLDGGVITSTQQAIDTDKNRLVTATLVQEDIVNHSLYAARGISAGAAGGIGFDGTGQQAPAGAPGNASLMAFQTGITGTSAGVAHQGGAAGSVTRSGIAGGALVITDAAQQLALTGKTAAQAVAAANRDVVDGQGSGALAPGRDGEQLRQSIAANATITAAFGQMAARTIGDIAKAREDSLRTQAQGAQASGQAAAAAQLHAQADSWAEGGLNRVALHAAAGALAGGAAGAAGAASSAALMPQVAKAIDQAALPEGLKKAGQAAAAVGLGALVGGAAGAASGLNVEANNRQLHPAERERIQALAGNDPQKEARLTAAACALVQCYAEYPVDSAAYQQLKQLAEIGNSEALAAERQTLSQQAGMFAYTTGGMFSDASKDALKQLNNTYQVGTRLLGVGQAGLGALGLGASLATAPAACATGVGCVANALTGTLSLDALYTGSMQAVSGDQESTYLNQGLQSLGLSPQAAGIVELALGTGAAVTAGINAGRAIADGVEKGVGSAGSATVRGGNSVRPGYLTSAEFAELPKTGMIDPRTIRYSQDSAAAAFKPPYGKVDDFIQGLRVGEVNPAAIDPVRIVQRDGKIFTLDNRRLYSFEQAGIEIPYQKLDAFPKRELFKFTTTNDGASIIIRKGK